LLTVSRPKTGREIAMDRVLEACKSSTVADIHRASMFLERAAEIRAGCKQQRKEKRYNNKN
jgi:hypothetical protein